MVPSSRLECVAPLAKLSNLRQLHLDLSPVLDRDMQEALAEPLRQMTKLTSLQLSLGELQPQLMAAIGSHGGGGC